MHLQHRDLPVDLGSRTSPCQCPTHHDRRSRPHELGQFVPRHDSAWYRVSVGTTLLMGLGHQQV